MKQKYFLYITIGVLSGCTSGGNEDLSTLPEDSTEVETTAIDADALQRRAEGIAAELAYYLERHNVLDEGYDMVARYADEGDSALSAYMPIAPLRLFGIGRWRNIRRSGTALTHDALRRPIIGRMEDDTLVSGIRLDTAGVYAGRFTRNGEAQGHGGYLAVDGSYASACRPPIYMQAIGARTVSLASACTTRQTASTASTCRAISTSRVVGVSPLTGKECALRGWAVASASSG